MKALVYTGTGRISLRDEPEPPARNGEVIVRIQACGICGSDMHAYHGQDPRRMPPMILGHEAIGVAESGYHAGKQVVINPLTTCGDCSHCRAGRSNLCSRRNLIGMNRPGAFAERVAVLERNLLIVPDGTELTRAVLTEPTACAVHAVGLAVRNSLCPLTETRALVLGGGAIGLLSASVLKNYGCDDIALGEVWESRRVAIDKLGIGHTYDPFDHKARQQAKFDLVIDAVGSGRLGKRQANVWRREVLSFTLDFRIVKLVSISGELHCRR